MSGAQLHFIFRGDLEGSVEVPMVKALVPRLCRDARVLSMKKAHGENVRVQGIVMAFVANMGWGRGGGGIARSSRVGARAIIVCTC